MSAMAKRGAVSKRYMWAKLVSAGEAFWSELLSSKSAASNAQQAGMSGSLSAAVDKFKQTYNQQLTTVIAMTGAAMAPSINKEASTDRFAIAKLVVRLISNPSAKTVGVGDVVAFHSPLDRQQEHVMVRRVAALEGMEMVSDEAADESFVIPHKHLWVLADNPALEPPDVVDSRVFGFIPMSSIMGRIIYQVRSRDQHGPVTNSPRSELADQAVIDGEVDIDELTAEPSKD